MGKRKRLVMGASVIATVAVVTTSIVVPLVLNTKNIDLENEVDKPKKIGDKSTDKDTIKKIISPSKKGNADLGDVEDVENQLSLLDNGNLVATEQISKTDIYRIFDNKIALRYGITLPAELKGTKLQYVNSDLKEDGTLILTIKISKNNESKSIELKVDVTGITKANKERIRILNEQKALLDEVNAFIFSLDINNFSSFDRNLNSGHYTKIDVLKIIKSGISNVKAGALVKISDIYLKGDDINGTLEITVKNHGPDKIISLSNFKTIDQQVSEDIDKIKQYFESQNISINLDEKINNSQDIMLNESAAAKLGIKLPKSENLKGISLTYSHDEVNSDGLFNLIIKIAKGDTMKNATIIISVSGINEKVSSDIVLALSEQNFISLNKPNRRLSSSITKKEITKIVNLLNHNNKIPSIINENDIVLKGDDDLGTMKVTISNHGPAKEIILKGFLTIKEKDDSDIERVKKDLNVLTPSSPVISEFQFKTEVPKEFNINQAKKFNLTLPDLKGTTLTYTTSILKEDGELTLYILISKPNRDSKTAEIKFNVSGITKGNKQRAVDLAIEYAEGFLVAIKDKGLFGVNALEFIKWLNKIIKNPIMVSVIKGATGFDIGAFFDKDITISNFHEIIEQVKNNGVKNLTDNQFMIIEKIIEKLMNKKTAGEYIEYIKIIKELFNSNIKDALFNNKKILDMLLPTNVTTAGFDLTLLANKMLFDGFNSPSESTSAKEVVKEMSDYLYNLIIEANIIKGKDIPQQAKDWGVDLAKVQEIVKEIIHNLLANIIDSVGEKYQGRDLKSEIVELEKEIIPLEKESEKLKAKLDKDKVMADYTQAKTNYEAALKNAENPNNPYVKIMNEIGLTDEILKDLDDSSFVGQLGSADSLKSSYWYSERSDIDATIAIMFWHKYSSEIKSKTNIETKAAWLAKIGKKHYDEDYAWNTSSWDDEEKSDYLYVQKYIKQILPNHYQELRDAVKKINMAYLKNSDMFDNKGVDQSAQEKVDDEKEKMDSLKVKIDEYEKAKNDHDKVKNKIDKFKRLIKRIEYEKKIGFNSGEMRSNEFFKGKGLLELNEKDLKNMIISISSLFVDISNLIDQAISDAVDTVKINYTGNWLTRNVASLIAPTFIKSTVSDLEVLNEFKKNRYLAIFNDIDPKSFADTLYKLVVNNVSKINGNDVKLILKFIKKINPEWNYDLSDKAINFMLDLFNKGIDTTKKDHIDDRLAIQEIIEKIFGLRIEEEKLKYIISG